MMSYFFLTSTASVWIAILYMFLGLPLLLNPVASGTFFVWALAAGSAVYAIGHLVRYIQERKEGIASGGDVFLTVVPLLFTTASLIWPQTVLAFLPLVLGALLLVDAIGKVPLTIGAIELESPAMIPLAMSCFFPALLGILLMVNPFSAAHIVIRLFGIVLMINGVIELISAVISHRAVNAYSAGDFSSETHHL